MSPSTRIIVNTLVQYVKAVVSTCLTLYATRIILLALTSSDYGLYMLIAGVVTMLGFITNSLIVTTQRYISVLHGKGNIDHVRRLYHNSMVLHWLIGLLMALCLVLVEPWLMSSWLKIPEGRFDTAVAVYYIMVLILFITILSAPLRALFIARENIIYIAVVEIVDAVVKLCIAFWLLTVQSDRLLLYVWALAAIQMLNFFAFWFYGLWRFPECTFRFRRSDLRLDDMRQLLGFAGWTTYGMGAVAARAQGIAMLLNHFFGTVINAAYGIAMQVYMGLSIVTTSIFNAMNPQIMKAEGEGDRRRMLIMAGKESKYSVALMTIVSVPIMFEMDSILGLWLPDEPPMHTALFCRFILVAFLFDLLTLGLNTAVQAVGELRLYTLVMFTPKLLTLPIAWAILHFWGSVSGVMWAYVLVELVMALARLSYMKRRLQLSVADYLRYVLLPTIFLLLVLTGVGMVCMQLPYSLWRIFITFLACGFVGLGVSWAVCLNRGERQYLLGLIRKLCSGTKIIHSA